MSNIYVGQTHYTFELNTGLDLTNVTSAYIQYYKPNGTAGSWPAIIVSPATGGIVTYDIVSEEDLGMSGQWTFWVHLVFTDTTEIDTDPTRIDVYVPGKEYIATPYGVAETEE